MENGNNERTSKEKFEVGKETTVAFSTTARTIDLARNFHDDAVVAGRVRSSVNDQPLSTVSTPIINPKEILSLDGFKNILSE